MALPMRASGRWRHSFLDDPVKCPIPVAEVQDGHGVEKLVDGSVFEVRCVSLPSSSSQTVLHASQGQFKNGDKCGKGKFTWNTGGSYEA